MRQLTLIAAATLTATGLLGNLARAELLVNGGFESQPNWGAGVSGDAGYTLFTGGSIPGWTIEPGYGATIHNTVLYPTISGNYSLNTDGEGYNNHNINMYQLIASTLGDTYTFSFDWKNWSSDPNPQLSVTITDSVSAATLFSGTYGQLSGTHTETANYIGTGNALVVRIQHNPESHYNDNAFIADNFSVVLVPAPTTATALLLTAGAMTRRRRAR